jgi:hypothetical protein
MFAWAKREGLEALIPVALPSVSIRGLYPVEPYVRSLYPPVDVWLVSEMLKQSRNACTWEGDPLEKLFYLNWDQQRGWKLTVPVQSQHPMDVSPVLEELDPLLYANTIMEIHSHNRMPAFFSDGDNAGEKKGFRLFGVLGGIDDGHQMPEIRMRVGIYEHFWEIPAGQILSLPWGMADCVLRDQLATTWRVENCIYGA